MRAGSIGVRIAFASLMACTSFGQSDPPRDTDAGPPSTADAATPARAADAGDGPDVAFRDPFAGTLDCLDWSPSSAAIEVRRDTSTATEDGTGSCRMCLAGNATVGAIKRTLDVKGAGAYQLEASVRGTGEALVDLELRAASGADLGGKYTIRRASGTWERMSTNVSTGEAATSAYLEIRFTSNPRDCLEVDDVVLRYVPR